MEAKEWVLLVWESDWDVPFYIQYLCKEQILIQHGYYIQIIINSYYTETQ